MIDDEISVHILTIWPTKESYHINTTTENITRTTIMKIPANSVQPSTAFHHDLMDAKTKTQVIDVLCRRGSSQR